MTEQAKTTPDPRLAEGLDIDALRRSLRQIEAVGWALSHHLPVPSVSLSLDEALNLSALLNRTLP